jgi:3-hydroxybutyryl-CoA dehydratase
MSAAGRYARVGESFEQTVHFDATAISDFAQRVGDTNPLHHDAAVAAASRFGGLIACGPHTSSLLMGATAAHFSRRGASLGLDFRMQFRHAVKAGTRATLRWTVTRVEAKPSLAGELVSLTGELLDEAGARLVSAEGLVLVTERL